jgi:1,4-alpha-glucan branching enzyme
MQARRRRDWLHGPMSIYEVHLGSWQRAPDGGFLDWDTLAERLIAHVQHLHFTHIELLPITEHPLDDSWGYQATGYFAPTRRFGPPAGLKRLVDACHCAGIGVLLDWVPAHFPRDAYALARFDGEPLFEYADARKGEHLDWGTYVFDYGRNEVRSFLLASACYWLEHFHFDGLRVDAVASMLYLDFGGRTDYPRNLHGGRENLEAMGFLQQLNTLTHSRAPGTVIMAEESTDWAGVSRPVDGGGLGFSMKWNLGWMHDTLDYLRTNPLFRSHVQDRLTFYLMYAWSENFILPLSHDEVVHLKRSLLGRMPGDRWQQLANLRLLYAWMWLLPGKKLLFMGSEFAQPWEWDFRSELPWSLLDHAEHRGVMQLVADLNALYVSEPALYSFEFEPQGFEWIDCHDRDRSVLSFLRRDAQRLVLLVANFTPVPRPAHRIGVPDPGVYDVRLNTDAALYGGGNTGNAVATAEAVPCHGRQWSVLLDLPPLGALVLVPR